MHDSSDPAFSDADLARLRERLRDAPDAEALPADAMQGMFCALASGPGETDAGRAVAAALGEAPDAELASLARGFFGHTRAALDAGRFDPLLHELRRGRLDYRTWCRGYLAGVEACDTDWYAAADPEEMDEILAPFRLLADDLEEHERRTLAPARWRRRLLDAEQHLGESVLRAHDYWRIVRSPPATVRREAPKVGRNDPCPCGSGRKFKQCHGREGAS